MFHSLPLKYKTSDPKNHKTGTQSCIKHRRLSWSVLSAFRPVRLFKSDSCLSVTKTGRSMNRKVVTKNPATQLVVCSLFRMVNDHVGVISKVILP